MEAFFLGIDIGTSSCKAILFDEKGREAAAASSGYPIYRSGPIGAAEQDPHEIWQAVCDAVVRLRLSPEQRSKLAALSISSQISSHFFVDGDHRPLTRIVSWMDRRASTEAAEMKRAFSPTELRRLLGATLPAGASWPVPKLKWFNRYRPGIIERANYIVQPKDWVLWKMTGQWKTDVSSLRGIVHQQTKKACLPLLEWAGVSPRIVPPSGEPWEVVGQLLPHAAEALRLPVSLPVVLGWNDLNAAVLGLLGSEETIGFDMTGTSEHIGIVVSGNDEAAGAEPGINRIFFTGDKDLVYGVTSSGGYALQWFASQVFRSRADESEYETIMEAAAAVTAGSEQLLFLPYLQGERSPWWNPDAKGVFFGLSPKHDRSHMARAVLEGVGFALKAIYVRLGRWPSTIRIAGGASKMKVWNGMKANILGVPVQTLETSEAGCLGAAMLAAYGTGAYATLEQAAAEMTRVKDICDPVEPIRRFYEDRYPYFEELYHTLEPLFEKTSRLKPLQEGGVRP
ncbi:hypothetical protein SD70_13570 [Gordoniibacillus kamchatkensis]|uniref:Xylulokinase n=1 Tax=Gordoniibacillus kamchatkensis TaxID=1590651 RepID=A0ABR5AH99_9BACL|nr:FGGY family carbohydrate kinase [Paenibacillus sp. VKM B-2647]KIL40438.1 hypothetical protein SD70_13570 [Paenibacillus sp. VKM B-2647]